MYYFSTDMEEWEPLWYADRLHAVAANPRFTLCGCRFPHMYSRKPWFLEKLQAGPEKCRTCQRVIDKQREENEQTRKNIVETGL